ncbi:MAG: PQQ-binding-like beta-propeller repeat protein [Acidobacteria bacterium]|nr:PQQ-binding-like beta-propeller repeat protein [Acidobacteriota bacterium]
MTRRSALSLLSPLLAGRAFAGDWPQLRGPDGSGLCPSCSHLPTEFGPGKNVLWKTDLPPGKSSPVLVGDRIFLTASDGEELVTLCLDRPTGAVRWRSSVRAARHEPMNDLNDRAAPTAVVGDDRVFVFFSELGLVAYDFDGKELWQTPLGPFNSQHGVVASPVYADGRVVLVCDQDTDAYIIALDAETGEVAWKVPRNVINGYATPIIHRPESGPTQVIAPGSYQLTAYSIVDGEPIWFVRGLTCQPKSAPVIVGDTLYFNGWTSGNDPGQQVELPEFPEVVAKADADHNGKLSQPELPKPWQPTGSWRAIDLDRDGFLNEREWTFFRTRRAARNGLLAVKLGGSGDVTETNVLWRFEKGLPDVPTPLVYDDVLYLFKNGGIATSLDARTGKVLKQGRLTGALDNYYASPVGVDGKIYVASEQGKVVVLRAAAQWEILAVNEMDAPIYATPAITDDIIYLRTQKALYAFAQPK